MGLTRIGASPTADRLTEFIAELSEARFLLVLDNIETHSELGALAPLLLAADAFRPSKLVITSRVAVRQHAPVRDRQLREFTKHQSRSFLREEARRADQNRIAEATDEAFDAVFDVVGGNPLALQLAFGLMQFAPIDEVIRTLRTSRTSDPFYRWIYWRVWQDLSAESRELLVAMSRLSVAGVGWERLRALTNLGDQLTPVVEELDRRRLLIIQGTFDSPTYSLHRLTSTFAIEVLSTWDDAGERRRLAAIDQQAIRANVEYALTRRLSPHE